MSDRPLLRIAAAAVSLGAECSLRENGHRRHLDQRRVAALHLLGRHLPLLRLPLHHLLGGGLAELRAKARRGPQATSLPSRSGVHSISHGAGESVRQRTVAALLLASRGGDK